MSGFVTKTGQNYTTQPDPTKHVNYVLGMVLGVDDFTQEFAYLAGRDQWLARVLLGYGTVCGLRVSIEPEAKGPRIEVASGTALTPRGQLVHVPSAQCASLNDWLAVPKNVEELLARLGSPPGTEMSLYVVLCYRECPTDMIPIPGEPCRSEDDSLAPSRVQDDFRLELRFTPSEQREEEAVRDFVEWLRQVEITDDLGSFATLDEFLAAVRAATHFIGSPPQSPPDFMFGSPPFGLRIPAAAACAYLRAAFRVWVTELRPLWLGKGQTCRIPPDEECVLLAEVTVPLVQVALSGQWRVDDSRQVSIDEERRPYLLPLRLLQEWSLCGRGAGASSGGGGGGGGASPANSVTTETAFGQPVSPGVAFDYSRADHTHGTPTLPPIPTPPAPATTVEAETAFGRPARVGTSLQYSRADHTHGTPPAPTVSGNSVTRPSAAGSFAIVAAGVLSAQAQRTPVYNSLKVIAVTDGEVRLSFNGYKAPKIADEFQYIIKVLPVFRVQLETPAVLVNFDRYEQDGFVLRVATVRGDVIKAPQLALVELMIEVSQYPFAA